MCSAKYYFLVFAVYSSVLEKDRFPAALKLSEKLFVFTFLLISLFFKFLSHYAIWLFLFLPSAFRGPRPTHYQGAVPRKYWVPLNAAAFCADQEHSAKDGEQV